MFSVGSGFGGHTMGVGGSIGWVQEGPWVPGGLEWLWGGDVQLLVLFCTSLTTPTDFHRVSFATADMSGWGGKEGRGYWGDEG